MAIEGLTQQQSDFVERFLKVPKVFNRKAMKKKRREATEQFRLFNAESDLLREEIGGIADPELRSVMMAQLRAAEGVIESDPKNLNFDGGHQQLDDVRAAMLLDIKLADAKRAHEQLQKAMSRMDADNPLVAKDGAADGQSDIALTWAFIEEKFASGTGTNDIKTLEAAIKAMGRLEVMMRNADKAGKNPFEALSTQVQVDGVKAAAQAGLNPKALEARGRLLDTFNQLAVLREKLDAQFGEEKAPLALQMGCTATRKILDDAMDAPPELLPLLADDAETSFAATNKDATKLIKQAQEWIKDKSAFQVRYLVMKAHPAGAHGFVKPKFDGISTAYKSAKDHATAHEYIQASSAITVVRNDLKDVLDFADDFANYATVYKERKALLASLPPAAGYPLPKLNDDHDAANLLLSQAETERKAGQMRDALRILNSIPKAVEDIVELNKFATRFKKAETEWDGWHKNTTADASAEVQALIKDALDYSTKAGKEAQDDAAAGDYKRAAGRMGGLWNYAAEMYEKAEFIQTYLDEKTAFTTRRRATRARRGAEGRIAIESYYQGLVGDEAKRAAAHAAGDFKLAKSMCQRLEVQQAEMMGLADDAKDYLAEKASFDTELAKLGGAASADATEAKAAAEQMNANAVAATMRGNWIGAANLLQAAILEIRRAVNDVETAALIDGHQGGADGIKLSSDSEFKTVYATFTKVLEHVKGLDSTDMFGKSLKAADKKARSVEAMLGKDLVKADATMTAALADCRAVALRLSAAASYEAQRAITKAVLEEAEQANADKVINAELKQTKSALAAVKKMIKSPAYDFDGAIQRLAEAQATAELGLEAALLYTSEIEFARTEMEAAIKQYNDPAIIGYVGVHATRIKTTLDEMNADFAARKLAPAAAKAAKGIELAELCRDIAVSCYEAVDFLNSDVIDKGGPEMTHPLTAVEAKEVKNLTDLAITALGKGSFSVALQTGIQAYRLMRTARTKAAGYDLFQPVKQLREPTLVDLETRTVIEAGPGHEAVLALRKTFDDCVEQEALENYNTALKRLDGFALACHSASEQLDQYDRYALRKKQAQEALEKVRHMKSGAIETLLARLEGKERNAERKGQGFDFAIGTALFEELKDECDNAKDTAEAVENLAGATSKIKDIVDGDVDDLRAAIGKARKTLMDLSGQPSGMYVHQEVVACRTRLDDAEKTAAEGFPAARQELSEVVDISVQLTLLMAQYDQLNDSAAVARKLAEGLLKREPEVGIARDEIGTRMTALEGAMSAARKSKSNRAQTQTEVEETISALRDLRKVVDAHKKYLDNRAPVETTLAELEKSKQRHLIREDLSETRKLLDTAATRAADQNHKSAEAELKKAAVRLDMAKLRAKLATNTVPDLKDLKAILEAPDGLDQFDSIIDKLEASVQRKVMAVAFEARFGCKLDMKKPGVVVPGSKKDAKPVAEDAMELPAANLRRFFKEMSKLPESNTLDNDSMLSFEHVSGEQTGSAYNFGVKKILMREGDAATSSIYAISVEHEIGDLHPDAIPKPGEARTAFSWNTLHEVGHAVDDKLNFMKKHGERLAGWKVYGAKVTEPAGIIAGEFDFDADYVAEYMLSKEGRKLPVPDPVNCSADEWNRRMEECRMFVDRAREGNDPWTSASIAKACGIGNFTYVESYEGDWARYSTDQRQYAVSGYQFRAPGEWFSELYAAVCTDRLNDSHPHRAEIAKLCLKEDA